MGVTIFQDPECADTVHAFFLVLILNTKIKDFRNCPYVHIHASWTQIFRDMNTCYEISASSGATARLLIEITRDMCCLCAQLSWLRAGAT